MPEPIKPDKNLILNVLVYLGFLVYLGVSPAIPGFTETDLRLKGLAYSIALTLQVLRGLLFLLNVPGIPQWVVLTKLDKRTLADTSVVFISTFLLLEAYFRINVSASVEPAFQELVFRGSTLFTIASFVFGGWLYWVRTKQIGQSPLLALIALPILMLVFLLPFLLVGGVCYGIYYFMDLRTERDISALLYSASLPILIASLLLFINDRRDRTKNTINVFKFQLMLLPAAPLGFFLLRAYWPSNLNMGWFLVIILAPIVTVLIPMRIFGKSEPWLIREKVELLQAELNQNQEMSPVHLMLLDSRIEEIKKQLEPSKLKLKRSLDHLDRADAYWKLGDLQLGLTRLTNAEECFENAIKSYNVCLDLEPNNGKAIGNKFMAVEALREVQRQRLLSADSTSTNSQEELET